MGPHNSSNSQGNAKMVIHKWRRKSDPEYTRTYFLGKTRTKPHEVYQPRSLGVAQASGFIYYISWTYDRYL